MGRGGLGVGLRGRERVTVGKWAGTKQLQGSGLPTKPQPAAARLAAAPPSLVALGTGPRLAVPAGSAPPPPNATVAGTCRPDPNPPPPSPPRPPPRPPRPPRPPASAFAAWMRAAKVSSWAAASAAEEGPAPSADFLRRLGTDGANLPLSCEARGRERAEVLFSEDRGGCSCWPCKAGDTRHLCCVTAGSLTQPAPPKVGQQAAEQIRSRSPKAAAARDAARTQNGAAVRRRSGSSAAPRHDPVADMHDSGSHPSTAASPAASSVRHRPFCWCRCLPPGTAEPLS